MLSQEGSATDSARHLDASVRPTPGNGAVVAAILVSAKLLLLLLPVVLVLEHALPGRPRAVVIPDASRYQQLLAREGRPYRDFPVEYPPVLLGAARLLHGSTIGGTLIRVGFFTFLLDGGIALLLLTGWGRRPALAYLALGLPLAFFVYFRLDLLSVFLAALGLWLVKRRREGSGGLALALAVFTKIWPAAFLPLLAARARWRAVGVALLSMGAGLVAWVAWGGTQGPIQVLTFRGATGWQVESLVGSIQWATLGAKTRFEAGAIRVGGVSAFAAALMLVAILALLSLIAVRSSRTSDLPEGIPALAATVTLLLVAPVLSPQYLSWLLPWAAIATGLRDRPLLLTLGFVTFATGVMWWLPLGADGVFKGLLLARNAGLVVILVMCIVRLTRRAGDGDRTGDASDAPVSA